VLGSTVGESGAEDGFEGDGFVDGSAVGRSGARVGLKGDGFVLGSTVGVSGIGVGLPGVGDTVTDTNDGLLVGIIGAIDGNCEIGANDATGEVPGGKLLI
jgi:hypothetical protein